MKLWRELEPGEKQKGNSICLSDANHNHYWLVRHDPEHSPKQWPEPRDVRTDPPQGDKCLLFSSCDKTWHLFIKPSSRMSEEWSHWVPLPPAPPQKSEAERAWEAHVASVDGPYLDANTTKEVFLAGFEAAKKGKA